MRASRKHGVGEHPLRSLTLLASAILASAAWAQEEPAELKEKLDWLQEKMAVYAKSRTSDSRKSEELSYAITARSGCLVEFTRTTTTRSRLDESETRKIAKTVVHLGELQPGTVKVWLVRGEPGWKVSLRVKDEYVDLVEKESTQLDSQPAVERERKRRSLKMFFEASSIARRAGSLLEQAAELCAPQARPEKRKP